MTFQIIYMSLTYHVKGQTKTNQLNTNHQHCWCKVGKVSRCTRGGCAKALRSVVQLQAPGGYTSKYNTISPWFQWYDEAAFWYYAPLWSLLNLNWKYCCFPVSVIIHSLYCIIIFSIVFHPIWFLSFYCVLIDFIVASITYWFLKFILNECNF